MGTEKKIKKLLLLLFSYRYQAYAFLSISLGANEGKLRRNQFWLGKGINLTFTFLMQRLMWKNCRVK